MTRALGRWWLAVAVALSLAACAPEVTRHPAQLTPIAEQPAVTIEVLQEASVRVGPGYDRKIPKGSVWTSVGRIPEGQVFKPVDRVFTVEGAHVHEAYLVLDGDRVVGFYLPVERAFSPRPGREEPRLSIQRRQR
jgi:hypothetical protein